MCLCLVSDSVYYMKETPTLKEVADKAKELLVLLEDWGYQNQDKVRPEHSQAFAHVVFLANEREGK